MLEPRFATAILILGAACVPLSLAQARELSFDERVRAQEAIERVYHAHRIGTDSTFEQAVDRDVLERKVRHYLRLSAALEQFWGVRVTGEALRRETQRIAARTRFPERLSEVYRALDDDPVLVQECLARPALVERLARARFEQDPETGGVPTREDTVSRDGDAELDWDTWWHRVQNDIDEHAIRTVALGDVPLPVPVAGIDCLPDDTWRGGTFDDLEERAGHTAVWTGSEMLIWGGQSDSSLLGTGRRYDPVTDSWGEMSVAGAPTARSRHTAVWTGTEMIVWGGWDGGYSGTGGRYDPVEDSWNPVSTVNAPVPREAHTAVLADDEMIIWGGRNGPRLDSGGRYNIQDGTWAPTSLVDAPTARLGHSAVWTTKDMIVWGGSDGSVTATGAKYDPARDQWEPVSTDGAPEARLSHAAVWTGQRMLIWGGSDSGSVFLDTGGRYNPNSNSWSSMSTSNAPDARYAHTAVWTGDVMVVWGGIGNEYLDTGGRYNPSNNSWMPVATEDGPVRRHGHTAIWTGNEMIVWGGMIFKRMNTGGRYDPVGNTWVPTAPATPESRTGHSAVWTGTHMLVWGGSSPNLGYQDTGSRYDPMLDLWTPTSTSGAPSPRGGHVAVWTGSLMVVWGGSGDDPGGVNTGGRYNPLTDSWSSTSTTGAPVGRIFHTAVWTGEEIVIWGGFPDLNTGGRYDPASDSWEPTTTTNAPLGRYWHTAVWSGDRVLVWGGYREPAFLDSGGLYDPVGDAWTATSTSHAPEGRFLHTAVWTGARMIVWGGNDFNISGEGTRFDNGGLFDPAANGWEPVSSIDAPSGRNDHTAVWTGREMVIWGGESGPPFTPYDVNTGGRYNPGTDTWVSTSLTEAPSVRRDHTAVWTGSDMLVWGGFSGPFGGPNDYPTSWGKYAMGHADDDDGDGFSECDGDCDDADDTIYPGAPELCDNRDNDCDGALSPEEADGDGDGSPGCLDCDDDDPESYPGAQERCDNLDNDCDDVPDEFITFCGTGECSSTGYCSEGVDSCVPGSPTEEVCDGLDNDCDGEIPTGETDGDGDGSSECEGDCDDSNAHTHPGATEVNDGHDNQCPGEVGHGLIDEISGQSGFINAGDPRAFCWPMQPMAVEYEASRSSAPGSPVDCERFFTPGNCWSDPTEPPIGGVLFYLVRANCQYLGSLGADSAGVERPWGCEHPAPACPD